MSAGDQYNNLNPQLACMCGCSRAGFLRPPSVALLPKGPNEEKGARVLCPQQLDSKSACQWIQKSRQFCKLASVISSRVGSQILIM